DLGELHGVVRRLEDGLAEVAADLALVDVERRRELDVADVIAPEPGVHQAGDELVVRGVPVVLDTLDESGGAIANTDDGYSDGPHGVLLEIVVGRAGLT